MKKQHTKFLQVPEFKGGKEAFKKYIKENLIYPKQAREKRIEGTVYLSAQIDDNGNVLSVDIEKGIGFGCDEEAVRLVKNIKYGKVKNRGVRLKTKKKLRINFKLPPSNKIKYNVVKNEQTNNSKSKTYSYSLKIGKNGK